jgi:tetratricopeptide (TPR) repeat protein
MAATTPTLDQQVGPAPGAQAESPGSFVEEAGPSPAGVSVMEEHAARSLLAFAEEAGRGLRGLDASLWRDRLQRRFQDLEAAFDWLLDHGQAGDALALASRLAEFLRITGRVATGRAWLDSALEAATNDDRLRAVALYENGLLAFWQGADEEACSLHGRSLELARRLDDRSAVAQALCGLARVALREDLDWARTMCEEALGTVQDTGDMIGRSNALHVLGVAAQMRGDLRQARDLMTQRIELARKLGDFATISGESSNLSMVERQLGNLARAEQLAREALQIEEQRGDEWAIPYSLNGLAAVAVETGELERAATLLGAAAALQERQGNAWPPDEAPHFERSRTAVSAALHHDQLERAWSAGQRMPSAHALRYALAPRADLAPPHKGDPPEAEVDLRGEPLRRARR